jgi:hypothetical protein
MYNKYDAATKQIREEILLKKSLRVYTILDMHTVVGRFVFEPPVVFFKG